MIHITLNHTWRKRPLSRFTCGIYLSMGKWSAPHANEVAP